MDQTSETEKLYQKTKYNEIIDILLGAGYFRARISNLSEFDKVVGGLCWCITSSGESVDVDILFQENSTMGQKITLSEAVVTALRKMGCPAVPQPHQIQGGVGGADYAAIHSAIVWLVKKYFERRVEREQQLRSYAIFQFDKNYQLPGEEDLSSEASVTLQKILDHNKPRRVFKRRVRRSEAEEARVRSCLLEFGESLAKLGGAGGEGDEAGRNAGGTGAAGAGASSSGSRSGGSGGGRVDAAGGGAGGHAGDGYATGGSMIDAVDMALADLSKLDINELSGFEKQLAKAAKDARKDEIAFAEKASREESEIMQQMSQIDDAKASAISGSQVGNIVGLSADEISSASAAYLAEMEESKKQLDQNVASGKLGAAAAFNRQMQNLVKQKEELLGSGEALKVKTKALRMKLRVMEEERNNATDYLAQLRAQLQKLTELEANSTQKKELMTIKELIALNESLKTKESEFKGICKTKRQELLEKIQALEQDDNEDTPEKRQHREIQDMHAKVLAKYNRLRQMLAEVNLEVASSVRVIDDTPTRTELIQYERRFVELYQQVAWKLEETRKYYDIYNTLDSTLSFIQKEVKLLNSISENFAEAMRSAASKMEFSKQFDNIVRGVEEQLKRQESTLSQKQQRVEEHKQIYQSVRWVRVCCCSRVMFNGSMGDVVCL